MQAAGFRQGQGGRRFVHDQQVRLGGNRLGDLDQLLLGDRKRANDGIGIHGDAQPIEDLDRLLANGPPIDKSGRVARQPAQEDVLGDGQG